MSTQERNPERWKSFTSLDWYDGVIEFLFRFVAKTSEPLLAAGIVYSAADVLSKGHLGSTSATMDNLWAISQALAIESSGGVVLVYGLESMKAGDRVKAWMYLLLSALLALTGGVMLFMQLAGLENQQIDSPLMRGLFALRCVVSVGYIYLCRTKAISFRNLNKEQPATTATDQQPTLPAQPQSPAPLDYQQLAQELAPLLQAVRTTIIEEVKASITGPENENAPSVPERRSSQQRVMLLVDAEKKREQASRIEKLALPVTERLEAAYQELFEMNPEQRISGRALAKRAHVDRQTCAAWLKMAHPENMPEAKITTSLPQVTATATATSSQPEPEVTAIALEPATTTTELQLAATASEERPQPGATTTTRQPEATATEPTEVAATTIGQPQSEATATVPVQQSEEERTTEPEPESITSRSQPEATATEAQPGIATDSQPEPAGTATEAQPQTAIDDQTEPTVTATEAQSGTATDDQLEPTVTATEPEQEAKETTTKSRPRQKDTATATPRKTTRPRQKATATQSKSK